MPIYILVTDFNYNHSLYLFNDNNDFINWYSNYSDDIESLQYINKDKDILFIDPINVEYAYVQYAEPLRSWLGNYGYS